MKFPLPHIFVFTTLHSIVPDNPCESKPMSSGQTRLVVPRFPRGRTRCSVEVLA